ncbi:MAG: hypothetical protein Q4D29_11820 [Lachnospiraceae bacterium]|nr:hypothetical protein [Lachnospiraceae bacterium]
MNSAIEKLFLAADKNLNCNTAYPIFKEEFKIYESDIDVMEGVTQLSYYIHIPFCKQLCKFCEYTRFLAGDKAQEIRYINLLGDQIRKFVSEHKIEKIYGLDIGGGTPSALDDDDFEDVLKLAHFC